MGKKILILAPPGFGKSTSMGRQYEPAQGINIEGLDPHKTFVISATTKDLPFRGSRIMFPVTDTTTFLAGKDFKARRICTNNAYDCAKIIDFLAAQKRVGAPIETIIIDDANYFWQDYFMANSLKAGWDAPKKVGHLADAIFSAMERNGTLFNFVMMAHYETIKRGNTGGMTYVIKTTGKSTQEYITPEGKFDVTLIGHMFVEDSTKVQKKVFVSNFDGEYDGARSAPGMFPIQIPNDLGYIFRKMDTHYAKQDELPPPFVYVEEEIPKLTPTPVTPTTEGV